MKRLFIFFSFLFAGSFLIAQEELKVPRYQGLAAGGGLFSQFPLVDYSEFALLNLGGSIAGEYTLPFEFVNNIDLGLAVRAEFAHVFPKAGTVLKSDEEIRAFGAFWGRFPFTLGNQFFAFQPEIGGGISTFFTKYEASSVEKNGTYLSPFISAALSFRWIPKTLQKLEVEAVPLFTIVPEQNKSTMMLGLRLGAIWHFKMKNETRTDEPIVEVAEFEPAPEPEQQTETTQELEIEIEQEPEVEVEPESEQTTEVESEVEEVPESQPEETEPESEETELKSESEIEAEPEVAEAETEVEEAPELEESEPEVEPEPEVDFEEESAPLPQKKTEPKLITERLKLKHILYFSKNGAVFTGLSRSQIRQNEKTIDEAVELIKQHPDCTVYIEGYAQNISGTEKEDRTACKPLSLWRAEYVRKELIKRGISTDKIETVGMGGANPIAGPDDHSNWWKNRRVEFVITYMSEVEDEK